MDAQGLKLLREKLNISQREMAERLGISLPTYGLYERGKPMHKPVELLAEIITKSLEMGQETLSRY